MRGVRRRGLALKPPDCRQRTPLVKIKVVVKLIHVYTTVSGCG